MKVNYVAPEKSVEHDITVIESNTGIEPFEVELPETPDREESNSERVEEGVAIINTIAQKEAARSAALANYGIIVDTQLKTITDVSSLDLTSVCSPDDVDLAAMGLPNPEDYGKTKAEVLAMTGIDGTTWPLPKPQLAKLDPKCFDIDDMYMSSLIDLDGMDMRSWDLPSFDFSWATDWDFPAGVNPSNVPSRDFWDFSDMDLGGIIDLSSISLPSWDIPDSFDIDWDFDTGIEFDKLTGIFDGMGSDGDLLGMGFLSSTFNGIKCVGSTIVDICTPDAIGDVLENFSIPGSGVFEGAGNFFGDLLDDDVDLEYLANRMNIEGYSDSTIAKDIFKVLDPDTPFKLPNGLVMTKTEAKGPILSAFAFLGDEWWWYDKGLKKYNYDMLNRINVQLLWFLRGEHDYEELVHATVGCQLYKDR